MVSIPEDIISDILVRAPVKSIGRFRCVSKAWCKLLKDHKFVKMHLKHAHQMNKFNIMHHNVGFTESHTISYDPSSSLSTCSDLVSVSYPFLSDECFVVGFYGSSNGLVCLTCREANTRSPNIVVIWNPCTNEYKELPISPSEESNDKLHLIWMSRPLRLDVQYGFIYDNKMEVFKVISLGIYRCNKYQCEIHVCTLGSNSWRRLEDIPYDLSMANLLPGLARVPVNGALHWIAFRESMGQKTEVILSFNTEKEIFEEIQMPNMFDGNFRTILYVLKESLCLLRIISSSRAELWELKEYGVKDSWTKVFIIDMRNLFGHVTGLTPLGSFENGEILLGMCTDDAFSVGLYDPGHETSRTLKVYDGMKIFPYHLSVYKESLVAPNCCPQKYKMKKVIKNNSGGATARLPLAEATPKSSKSLFFVTKVYLGQKSYTKFRLKPGAKKCLSQE